MADILQSLRDALGHDAVLGPEQAAERAASYWDSSPTRARALVRPASTEDVSKTLRLCHAAGQSVVVQGGLTGIVDGARSTASDVVISLERMNRIESVDALDGVAVVQSGAILQNVQEALERQGFLFPLDLGARGSCTIGGTVATNAGGMNVLRYGMMRNLVLGLEAVLADGTIVSSMNQMLKNNTGYDIKQLFIGSEGTLGVVTRVVVRLFPLPSSRQTVMFATDSFEDVADVLAAMKATLAGTLSAYEVMWNQYYSAVTAEGGHKAPLTRDYAFYVIAEAEGNDAVADEARFEAMLEAQMEAGRIVDAVIPKSDTERAALWTIREEFNAVLPAYLYDVSLPMRFMSEYAGRLEAALAAWRPEGEAMIFGHIADGNLHIFVRPWEQGRNHTKSDEIVYGCLDGLSGSISAEHGIGIEKRAWLGKTRSPEEIELMRSLKKLLDPNDILNPGKLIPAAAS